jgi:hypothetical protein
MIDCLSSALIIDALEFWTVQITNALILFLVFKFLKSCMIDMIFLWTHCQLLLFVKWGYSSIPLQTLGLQDKFVNVIFLTSAIWCSNLSRN